MQISLNSLILLIALVPGLAVLGGQLPRDFVALLILVAIVGSAVASDTGDREHTLKVTRGLKLVAILPAIWMLIQITPVPANLGNSIWPTAADALKTELLGHISIDIGDTTAALVQYSLYIILIIGTIFVARDRRHAELLLNSLTVIVIFTVVELSLAEFGLFSNAIGAGAGHSPPPLTGLTTLGIILSLAAGVRALERIKAGLASGTRITPFICLAVASVVGFAICLVAIWRYAPINVFVVTGFGVFVFCLVETIKRWHLAVWALVFLSFTALLATAMIVGWRYNSVPPTFLPLQFAEGQAPPDVIATTERMLADARWTGSGFGTFPDLWQLYRQAGAELPTQAPTTAASIAIEGGSSAIWFFAGSSVVLFVVLFRGALKRHRDWHYAGASAAAVIVVSCQSLCDGSFETTSVVLTALILVGLGLSQRISQTSHS